MPYFDFHLHPALKTQFNDLEKRDTPWEDYKLNFPVIDSQSSLSQLVKGNVRLIGVTLHVPEPNMASQLLKMLTSESFTIKLFRKIKKTTFKLLGGLLSKKRLSELGETKVNSYHVLLQELDNLEKNITGPRPGEKLVFLTKKEDYDESKEKTVFAFIVVEGLHCFKGVNDLNSQEGIRDIKNNIRDLCTKKHLRVLAVNPSHLQYNFICNHSFGTKIFENDKFYPVGDGIINKSAFNEIISELYRRNILVDIKHMSAKARHEFYKWRVDNNHTHPIICTHAGVAGLSRRRVGYFVRKKPKKVQNNPDITQVEYYKPLGLIPRTSFNISTINLYDEDIEAVLRSGGLIGISLDRRISGFTEHFFNDDVIDVEYLSNAEFEFLFGSQPGRGASLDEVFNSETLTPDDNREWTILDARYFLNQVFYILKIAVENSLLPQAMNGICVGSDFDGMIDSLFCCRTAASFPEFHKKVRQVLPEVIFETGFKVNGLDELIEKIFYDNGKKFVLNRLNTINVNQ